MYIIYVFNSNFRNYFGTLRLDLRLARAYESRERVCPLLVLHPQQLVILFRLAARTFSREVYTFRR